MPDLGKLDQRRLLSRRHFLRRGAAVGVTTAVVLIDGRHWRSDDARQPAATNPQRVLTSGEQFVPAAGTGLIHLEDRAKDAPLTALSSFDPYLHRTNGPFADPINLIFSGTDGNGVADAVRKVLGWPPVVGSPMFFLDDRQHRTTLWQLGENLGAGSRWHLRIEDILSSDTQPYVLAAVHHDAAMACGDVGGHFDEARSLVAQAFTQAGYSVTRVWLGNTKPGPQCDGTMTAGDGTAVLINLTEHRRRFSTA